MLSFTPISLCLCTQCYFHTLITLNLIGLYVASITYIRAVCVFYQSIRPALLLVNSKQIEQANKEHTITCTDGVQMAWCFPYILWLLLGGSISSYTFFHLKTFFWCAAIFLKLECVLQKLLDIISYLYSHCICYYFSDARNLLERVASREPLPLQNVCKKPYVVD